MPARLCHPRHALLVPDRGARGPEHASHDKELAMTSRLRWFWIAGLLTGCTSAPSRGYKTLPDQIEDNVDVLVRSASQPCGADADTDGDGKTDVRWAYRYDAQGRGVRDTATQLDGSLFQQNEYAWDNAGNIVDEL